jgi:hypothetical protein
MVPLQLVVVTSPPLLTLQAFPQIYTNANDHFQIPHTDFHAVVIACLRPQSPPYHHNKHSLSSIHSAEDHNQIPKLNIGSPITACLWSTVTPLPQLQAFPQLNTVQRTTIKYLH